ncbi:MAG: ATP-binding protein [Chloroflexaceae bacterium]|nr:ATP-binding protein [Chloroflexaceae bacterium]NJL33156.1 ATP-binding protein [Chloroflexaceae bacterium]
MKVQIRNLGIVREADIDLKPLTVFIGPNNTGKTWVAYALGGILGLYGWGKYIDAYINSQVNADYHNVLASIQQEILEKGRAALDIVQFTDECLETYVNHVASVAKGWITAFIGVSPQHIKDFTIHFDFLRDKEEILERIKKSAMRTRYGFGKAREEALFNVSKEKDSHELRFFTSSLDESEEDLLHEDIQTFVARPVFRLMQRSIFRNTIIFPAERTTLVTLKFKIDSRELNENETYFSIDDAESPSPPQPVGYFLGMLIDLYRRGNTSQFADNDGMGQLAQILETNILQGTVDFSTPEPHPSREIMFQANDNTLLGISAASSMVKELAPLVLYLKYQAKKGELIIIDEPEMNLHPEAQVRMAEFLAIMVHAGLRVLITTHSPYIIDHLTNLMKAAKHEDKDTIRDLFYLKQEEAFISQDNVAVYFFDEGTAYNILENDGLINWQTFSQVSERVSQIFFDMDEVA